MLIIKVTIEGLIQSEIEERLALDSFSRDFINHFFNWNEYIEGRYIGKKEKYIPNPDYEFKLLEVSSM